MLTRARGWRGERRVERSSQHPLDGLLALLHGLMREPLIAHASHGIRIGIGPRQKHAAIHTLELFQPSGSIVGAGSRLTAVRIRTGEPGITQALRALRDGRPGLVDGVAGCDAVGGVDKRRVHRHTPGTVQIVLQVGVEQLVQTPTRCHLLRQLFAFQDEILAAGIARHHINLCGEWID